MTFNVWGLPSWINGAHPERYPGIARALEQSSPHFILLQEVWSARAHNAAPTGDEWSMASSSVRGLPFRRSGLVSLSRFPIVDADFYPFRSGAWPDSLVCKGALKITVELDHSLRLNVWNVHLQAGPAPLIRSQQIAELAVWVRQADNGQIADLIGGDFNCTPDSEQHQELTRLLGVDVQQLESRPHFITYDGRTSDISKARTLDYVFIRSRQARLAYAATVAPAMNADRLADRFSDHLAVRMDLRLEFVPLTAQSPALDAGLAGGKQPF